MATELPFQTRVTHFRPPNEPCQLPFALGGATQHHPLSVAECHNSQDAVRLVVTPDRMIAVVTDGCSGTHPYLEASCHSSNEVGAKLLAYLVSSTAQRIATDHPRLSDEAFLDRLNDRVRKVLNSIISRMCGTDPAQREMFACDYLMATVVGCVVNASRFLVFYSGNGVIAVNGEIQVLGSEDGKYFVNDLIGSPEKTEGSPPSRKDSFRPYRSGVTSDLNSIFLATDGLARLATAHLQALREFTTAVPAPQQVENGFDFLLQEFRQKIAWNSTLGLTLDDDATFALLRRTTNGERLT